jgi:hypothetical protein
MPLGLIARATDTGDLYGAPMRPGFFSSRF